MIEGKDARIFKRVLRYGMVGGGKGAFIGDVHRKAAKFDGKAELVAASFSRSYENTLETGRQLALSEERLYRDYREMAIEEAGRADGIDFVVIVTPNHAHYPVAKSFLQQGINVVCDKPLTFEVEEAEELARLSRENNLLFCVTYTYSGYPMVKQAREMVSHGELGEIRMIMAEYPQEWLATSIEKEGQKQAAWRTDPELAGKSCCVGDIGSHIENTVAYISGLEVASLSANLDLFGDDRQLDTNASVVLKYNNGASGIYWCSQVAIGHDNDLRIRIYGSLGTIEWAQQTPNYLKVAYLGRPVQILSRGRDQLYPLGARLSRIPSGHPEGYYEAFANIYANFTEALLAKMAGQTVTPAAYDYPSIEAGIKGVRFIAKTVESSQNGAMWLSF